MAYRVLENFHDLRDATNTKGDTLYYEYHVGDTYPRKGKKASKERIEELLSSDNLRGRPVIEEVDESQDASTERDAPTEA